MKLAEEGMTLSPRLFEMAGISKLRGHGLVLSDTNVIINEDNKGDNTSKTEAMSHEEFEKTYLSDPPIKMPRESDDGGLS